ncbi:hypothetical protein NDU88_005324 [Pleurodeles waltl]|uniref:Uncharacterized protein n=1 Tax=Pleurodeles waltl TaxID=8319 RepID=A0AAV7N414_PLEWA|nr:hypothetical protein NDU88_005324 [Pleurodeles waltl]
MKGPVPRPYFISIEETGVVNKTRMQQLLFSQRYNNWFFNRPRKRKKGQTPALLIPGCTQDASVIFRASPSLTSSGQDLLLSRTQAQNIKCLHSRLKGSCPRRYIYLRRLQTARLLLKWT